MPIETRARSPLPSPGPFLAEITNHLDPTYMGGIEVALIKGMSSAVSNQQSTYIVKYLSPFSGVTSIRFEGNSSSDFNDVQKSYGMWMVPPDVGTIVMVIFIDGDPNQGYWIGCVSDTFQNHMIPGIAASTQTNMTPEQTRKYGTTYLPVGEYNKHTQQLSNGNNISRIAKPIHPFADRLLAQGLLLDTIRGVTSSSARREVPSSVFGISTPGPLDTSAGAPKKKLGYADNGKTFPVSRLGGSTFVMDDGDSAGQNELIRIRTRTGHQILMHNSQDLIYIANSKGTAWFEMTSSGKIDIYAKDSVSIHTEADFNFRADRDFNIEAGRNINMSAGADLNTNVQTNYSLVVGQDGLLSYGNNLNQTTGENCNLSVGAAFNLSSKGSNNLTASASTNIQSSGNHYETASNIYMNGPAAQTATGAASPSALPLFALPNRATSAGWADGSYYKTSPLTSIMQRVPTHEPWDQHENLDPSLFSSYKTDSASAASASTRAGTTSSANAPLPPPNGNQPAVWSKDKEFIDKVKQVATTLNCNYIDLLACMSFETGRSFNPAVRNRQSSATGLIQFMADTARGLGTTTEYLASLTRTQQMDWVLKYFKASPLRKVSAPSIEDLYMAILWPVAVGQPNTYVLFKIGTASYQVNHGLDIGNKGYITKADAASKPKEHIAYVQQQLANAAI